MLNKIPIFAFLIIIFAGCTHSPLQIEPAHQSRRAVASEDSKNPYFHKIYILKNDIYISSKTMEKLTAESLTTTHPSKSVHKLIAAGTEVFFSNIAYSKPGPYINLIVNDPKYEEKNWAYRDTYTDRFNLKIRIEDIENDLEITDKITPLRHHESIIYKDIESGRFKTIFSHLGTIYSPGRFINIREAKTGRNILTRNVLFHFDPDFSKCQKNEIPIAVSKKNTQKELDKNSIELPMFSFASSKQYQNKFFCISTNNFRLVFAPQHNKGKVDGKKWDAGSAAEFYRRISQEPPAQIENFGFTDNFFTLKDQHIEFDFMGKLIGACGGQCRIQGFTIVFDRYGKVLEIKTDQQKKLKNLKGYSPELDKDRTQLEIMKINPQLLPIDSLYYWFQAYISEVPFLEGDYQRLKVYANDPDRLNGIYKMLHKSVLGTEGSKFATRMSEIYNTNLDNTPTPFATYRKAGAAVSTFFVVLAQARIALANFLEDPKVATVYPSYLDEE